jgi:hypothetical protein
VTSGREGRLGDRFLNQRGELLGNCGFEDDPGRPEWRSDGGLTFWHYARQERLEFIFGTAGGLKAGRPAFFSTELTPDFDGLYMVEGFLDPKPRWLDDSPHFGGEGGRRWRGYIGDVLLRLDLPRGFRGVWVADYGHPLEVNAVQQGKPSPLSLGYDSRTGHEANRAYAHSLVPVETYTGGHLAPIVTVMRPGPGIAIPRSCVSVAEVQPRTKRQATVGRERPERSQ